VNQLSKPELLAPAGDLDCVRAAIENGADAIYFGLDCGFNARARAANFSVDNLSDLMELLHRRNVKGYVTLNTLAFPSELPDVEHLIRAMAASGVDALLVQDIGVARLAKAICPDLPLHASTQMTMTSAETIELAEQLGIERVVVARELSIEEIKDIRSKTDMPIETFVHGALCVAYSGQCLTSESLGGRSANRGQCAQACRLSYDLISDGQEIELGDQKYLLSPQDLAAYELTPELFEAGVCSLKIEGRLKTPEYVANITRHYREAIDAAFERREVKMSNAQKHDMEMSFSRGFSPGWLEGCDHKMLVPATSSTKRGVLAGSVIEVRGNKVVVDLQCPLTAGDGIVFDGDRTRGEEQGGRIYGLFQHGNRLTSPIAAGTVGLTFAPDSIDFELLTPDLKFWKTDDPRLNKRLRKTFEVADAVNRVALDLKVTGRVGERLTVVGVAENGARCRVRSQDVLELARKHATSEEQFREQLGRLGATVFELRNLSVKVDGDPIVPFSVFGQIRREIIEQLAAKDLRPERTIAEEPALPKLRAALDPNTPSKEASPSIHVLCRTLDQLQVAAEMGATKLYAEFADIREYGAAVGTAHANGASVYLATPRIQKPDEMGIFHSMSKHGADGILIRNFSGLKYFREEGVPIVADFSLNVANELTGEYLMNQGVERITASYDLNREQLFDLVSAVPPAWLECVIHQHMPMFHMEHCVFCAVLSPGTNKTNCGRPCDVHEVQLRDRIGMEHPLTADVGCRNTLYNAVPQSSAEIVHDLKAAGIRHFRLELLRQTMHEVEQIVELYMSLLAGQVNGSEVWQQLKANNRVGVTRGTLEERNPLAII